MSAGVAIEPISEPDRLERLSGDWWELWRRCPNATPFQCPAWLLPWWRHFSPGRLTCVAAWRDQRLIGLGLFHVEDGPRGRRLLPLGIGISDHLDILLGPADREAAATAIVSTLAADGAWETWELENLLPDADAFVLPCPAGCIETVADQCACPVLHLAGGRTALPRAIPPDQRRKLRRAWRLASERGEARIVCVDAEV